MQMTMDGFVAGPEGQLDGMTNPNDLTYLHHLQHLTKFYGHHHHEPKNGGWIYDILKKCSGHATC